ncbi:hypothetical protein [Nocardioides sp. GCM10030258]|uniref:hypothetical protein n=1 Tax=unclassified Nocardioides TaxID=2615069 RepID=UPI0036066D73
MTRTETATPFYRFEVELFAPDGAPSICTAIYCSTEDVSVTRLSDELTGLADDRLIPDRIVLLGRGPLLNSMRDAATSERILEMVPLATRFHSPPELELVTIDRHGRLSSASGSSEEPTLWEPNDSERFMQAGLRAIMKERGVVLTTNGYHFAKPSRRHSDRFIRTANALRNSSETSFIAANLLRLLPDDEFDRVYTDTSSINAVAYALKDHLRSFDPQFRDFTIDSFGSHVGADGNFNLAGTERALILVSATTSGGLIKKLETKQNVDPHRVITLCYVGHEILDNVVCDLTLRDSSNPAEEGHGLHKPFPNWEKEDCPDCLRGHSLVQISGDQFLPASPSISMQVIKQSHAPNWLNRISNQLQGLGVIRAHVANAKEPAPRSLYLDFGPLIEVAAEIDHTKAPETEGERLAQQLHRRILRDVPAGTNWIVHLDDDASHRLALLANDHLSTHSTAVAEGRIIKASDLIAAPEAHSMDGLVLVVASAVVSGRSLASVSQALRTAHGDNPIAYLILAARTPTASRLKVVRNNLGYGNGQFDEHKVSVLIELALPDDRENASSPWAHETILWMGIRDAVEDPDAAPDRMKWLNDRIRTLEGVGETGDDARGLTDELFLRNQPDAGPLQLQPNFAFWDFDYDPADVAQSEVLFAVTAILHHMRVELGLLQSGAHEHNWTVLDPSNFARFNDPIIQAALLRAANPHELDYTGQREFSRDMTAVLEPLILNWDKADGGVAAEILLALATQRLRLHDDDLDVLLAKLDPRIEHEPLATLIAELCARANENTEVVP